MSASDAAPLPRLGEVFFDVRGSSRSMRLSWYADTGVAVFSIWQGGMCTGTFRLPIGDLPRMIEILERGPDDGRSRSPQSRRESSWTGHEPAGAPRRDIPPPGRLHFPDPDGRYPDEPRTGYSQPDAEQTSAVSFARDDLARSREEVSRPRHGGYGPDDTRRPASHGRDRDDYGQPPGPAYGQPEYGGDPYGGYQPMAAGEPDSGGYRDDDGGYGHERFVPPYVRGAVGEYASDIPQLPPGQANRPMRSAYREDPLDGYREDPLDGPSGEADYLPPPWPPEGYPDGPRYRLAGRPAQAGADRSAPEFPGRPGK